jgi:multidrug efflux pump subunit AcrA (membrane-fusion protein)
VPNPENLLRPNQVAKLKIIDYINKNAVVVPTNVIQEDAAGDKFVFWLMEAMAKLVLLKKQLLALENHQTM